jgi:hypothetical protein
MFVPRNKKRFNAKDFGHCDNGTAQVNAEGRYKFQSLRDSDNFEPWQPLELSSGERLQCGVSSAMTS